MEKKTGGVAPILFSLFAVVLLALITACAPNEHQDSGNGAERESSHHNYSDNAFLIASGSENKALEPIIQSFARREGVQIQVKYMGSVEMVSEMSNEHSVYDALWPAASLWIALGNEHDGPVKVKHAESIMRSPVVFAVKKSIARKLGWIDKKVTMREILEAAESKSLRIAMTSATQSNSGAMSYLASLYAFAGQPGMIESDHLRDPEVSRMIKRLLGSVGRSASSSGFLKSLVVERYASFDGMFNYEAIVIEANRELIKKEQEPLYAIYPVDGLAIADSPLGYFDKGDAEKEALFEKLQKYLLSQEVQKQLQSHGRRTGLVGMEIENPNLSVFNPAWGIDVKRTIVPMPISQSDVIREALSLYQTSFRKPSFTVIALDYSGSMSGGGERDLEPAIENILLPEKARAHMLEMSPRDITVVIPFNEGVINEYRVNGNDSAELKAMLRMIQGNSASGGTDMYAPALRAMEIFKAEKDKLQDHFPAIIIMTDGVSDDRFEGFKNAVSELDFNWDIPVFGITFGNADESQLEKLAKHTAGRVYNGKKDLVKAFKRAKGNN